MRSAGATIINFDEESVAERLNDLRLTIKSRQTMSTAGRMISRAGDKQMALIKVVLKP